MNSSTEAQSLLAIDVYRSRRDRVLAALRESGGGVAVIPTAREVMRNRDADYPFRHDSYFYYLTGFTEPEATLVLNASADAADPAAILFCREKNVERETWEGFRYGPEGARLAFGFDAAFPIDQLDTEMPRLLADNPALHYALGSSAELDEQVRGWLAAIRAQSRIGVKAPTTAIDLLPVLDEMRLIKDTHELDIMRRAGTISAEAHRRAMQTCRPGMHEYEIEAELLYTFRRRGAQAPAYGTIVAAGANACTLHYPAGNTIVRFTSAQREIYDIVLAAQCAAVDATREGVSFDAPHEAAVRVLAQGLLDTGIIDRNKFATVDDVIAERAYQRFYMHRTSHWLGMDVHDAGDYRDAHAQLDDQGARAWRTLNAGMTLTIEPGLYIRAAEDVPERYANIGIRIEDDAIVTANGCELMTREVPVDADEIEALMRDAQTPDAN